MALLYSLMKRCCVAVVTLPIWRHKRLLVLTELRRLMRCCQGAGTDGEGKILLHKNAGSGSASPAIAAAWSFAFQQIRVALISMHALHARRLMKCCQGAGTKGEGKILPHKSTGLGGESPALATAWYSLALSADTGCNDSHALHAVQADEVLQWCQERPLTLEVHDRTAIPEPPEFPVAPAAPAAAAEPPPEPKPETKAGSKAGTRREQEAAAAAAAAAAATAEAEAAAKAAAEAKVRERQHCCCDDVSCQEAWESSVEHIKFAFSPTPFKSVRCPRLSLLMFASPRWPFPHSVCSALFQAYLHLKSPFVPVVEHTVPPHTQ
eukprot:831491-Pelagomonas_calceolata.AAC.2